MDDFLDPFLSSSSWSDIDETERPSWVGPTGSRENGLPAAIVKACKGDEKEPPICMIPSSRGMGKLVTHKANVHVQDVAPSIFVGENLKYGVGLFTGENQQQQEVTDRISITPEHENHSRERSSLFQGIDERNLTSGSFAPEFNTSSFSHSAVTESGSFESNDSQPSVFPQSLGGSLSISALWSPSYSGVSTVGMGQGKVHGFGLQGEFLETDADVLGKRGLDNEKLSLLDSFPTALDGLSEPHNSSHLPSFTAGSQLNLMNTTSFQSHQQVLQGQSDLTNPHLSFVTGQKRTLNGTSGLQTHQQLLQTGEGNSINHYANHSPAAQSQSAQANGGSSNGAVKPRVRARRGQATDPHSIAERLRREKIAERMKNLQELVPNSNKTDKASMLDEIIDYVKFLQLQVKVLSMSRLGAAGAIVPLITDAQHEGSNSLLLSSSPAGQGVADLTESMDNLAFEQEVVKLMESNITTAMQYLQNKGLCLMPIALATAISGRKGSSCAIPPERKKSDVISQNTKSMTEGWNERKDGANGSNGAAVKQEEAPKP